MPIEPTWEETESVEEPKWEDTTDVETKTPGFLGPAFPLQEGEPPAAPQQAAPIPQEIMQDVPWMTRFRMSPVGRTLLGPTEEEKAGMAGEASGARIKPQEIAEQALEATTPAKALPFLSQVAPFVPLSPISPLLGGLPKAFESGIKEAAINFPLAPLPGPKTAAGRAALVAFGTQFLASQPETLKAFKDAIKRKDYDEATKIAATELAMAAGLGLGGKEALTKTKPPALPAQEAIAAAEPTLPQAAQAAKETKGAETYATEERNVPQDISRERAGDDALRTPPSPSSSGSLPTTTAIPQTEAPSPPPEQRGVLLKPVEQSASLEASAIDDWISQHPAKGGQVPARKPYTTTRDEEFAKAFNDPKISNVQIGQQSSSLVPKMEDARHAIETGIRLGYAPNDISAYLVKNYVRKYSAEAFNDLAQAGKLAESTPPPKETPTAPSAAEPSQLTPATQGISEATTPSEKAQAPPFAAKYDPETLMQRPAWVEPGSMLDKILGQLREKNDPLGAGKDIAPIWKRLTPAQRQDLAARGWVVTTERDPKAIVLKLAQDVPPARLYYGMQAKRALAESAPAQVSTEPFLGKTKAEWPDYYDTLNKEQKLSAISQTNRALKSAGLRPRLTTESQKPALLKAINEVIDLREKKKSATPTEPPPTLQLRVLPPLGIVEFVKQDVIPFVKKGVDTAKATAKLFVDTFSPASHAETPDVNILFEGKGFKEKVETRIVSAFENMKKRFDAMPQADQIAFVDRVKRGQAQPTPELQATANLIRKWDDVLYSLITRYKPTVPYLDNHMRVLWQKVPGQPTAIGTQKAGIRGKRPFQGSKGFLKKHVLADMSEGIRLGGVPVTYNPVELFTLHAQDVMKFVAANRAWEGLKRIGSVEFVRRGHKAPVGFVRFDDPIAKTYFRVPQGLVAPGEYYVQEGTGRMLHNYLSRDWVRTGPAGPIGRALLGLKNFTTNIELGMSPFHAFFESNEAIGSSFGLGLRKISSGQYLAGLKDIAQALPSSIPIVGPLIPKTAPWETAKLGGRLIKYAKNPAEFASQDPEGFAWLRQHYPETQKLVNDLFTAGGQVGMHQEYRYALRRGFAQAVRTENYVGAVIRALPALNEVMQKPLFETYIPRLKVGMWLREYSQALVDRAGDLATGKTTRPQLARETWSFIEDRFGELNWDNLYWNRTMKSAMQLMFRSVTWKLGNLRGFGKAGRDVAGEVVWRALVQGKAPRMSYPMMWLAGMSLVTAIQSSIISKVSTGKYPWELVDEGLGYLKSGVDLLKNLTFPRIDSKDPTQRVSIPTYWRDAVHIARSAKGLGWDYIRSSMTGEINRFAESLNNKDFYGHPIYNPLDPIQKRAYDFMAHLVPTPFGISSYQRATETGASTPQALAGVAGYTKAPAAIEPAPTSQVYDLAENWMAQQGGKTQETARRRAVQEQRHAEEPSIYQPLKIALKANRMEDAGKEYDKLLALRRSTESVSDRHKQILLALRPFTMGKKEPGTDYQPKHIKPFTGNLADEKKFLKSLTPEQRKIYDAAIASKQEIYQRFLELMKTR